jgi:hypothetical protein
MSWRQDSVDRIDALCEVDPFDDIARKIDHKPSQSWREPAVSQGKIVPLIAAAAEKERVRTDALDLRVDLLVADVRDLGRRLDEITEQLHTFVGNLRKSRIRGND